MIKHNVIFCEDKKKGKGFVYLTFFEKRKDPVRVSTSIKLSKDDYYTNKNDVNHRFNANKSFDYIALNNKIDSIVKSYTSLNSVETDFIIYFKRFLQRQLNGGTKSNYTAIYNRLKKEFPAGLPIARINTEWLRSYKDDILYTKYNLSKSYVKGIMLVLISCCKAITHDVRFEGMYNIKINTSSLNLKTNKTAANNLLCDADVDKLLKYEYNIHKPSKRNSAYFEYISFGLCQLFTNGSRFSDLLFLRFGDFKKEGILIQLPKTEDFKRIPYSIMLMRTLYKYIYRNNVMTMTELNNIDRIGFKNNEQMLQWFVKDILHYVNEQHPDDFFFSFVPDDLYYYESFRAFTDDEFKIFATTRGKYNGYLRRIAKHLDFDYPLTSHAFRYKFVANCRERKRDIYDISKMLCHSSVKITENYIRKHFEVDRSFENINDADFKYLKG
nr:tyrosine-type recombinase/integrase [uncultured Flavobacterium sp.]